MGCAVHNPCAHDVGRVILDVRYMREFTVVSWNVRYFSHHTGGVFSTDRNVRLAAQAVGALRPQPDFIALQEIDNVGIRTALGRTLRRRQGQPAPQLDRFVSCLNEACTSQGGTPYAVLFFPAHGHNGRGHLMSSGLTVLYRSQFSVADHNAPSPYDITCRRLKRWGKLKQTRICAWARFELGGGNQLNLFNTHVSLPAFLERSPDHAHGRFGEAVNQLQEVERLLTYVNSRRDDLPTLLVGDFNAAPDSSVYRRLVDGTEFRDAHAHHLGVPGRDMNGRPSAGLFRMRYRLDHLFCTQDVYFTSFSETLRHGENHRWKGLSDHTPVIGRFALGSAPALGDVV
jgi:endonuclease/exonuclease/phosphatase family metal-dependent hydrolase